MNPRLRGLPDVVLFPHMSSAIRKAWLATNGRVLVDMQTFCDGHRAPIRSSPQCFEPASHLSELGGEVQRRLTGPILPVHAHRGKLSRSALPRAPSFEPLQKR